MDMAAEVLPPWLEWASSMMMANLRPRCSLPISSRMKGNFCTVEMMIFLPDSMNSRSWPEPSVTAPTGGADLGELLDGVADLFIQNAPVGDHDDGIEDRLIVFLQTNQLVRQPGDGVGFSAAGRMLDQIALAAAMLFACLPAVCAPRPIGGSAGRSARGFLAPGFFIFGVRRSGRNFR